MFTPFKKQYEVYATPVVSSNKFSFKSKLAKNATLSKLRSSASVFSPLVTSARKRKNSSDAQNTPIPIGNKRKTF
eukprot:UN09788